jgi:hypothetical protein
LDQEALELPIGDSADPAIHGLLSHKLPQPGSTGASLREEPEFPGMMEEKNPTINEPELTAQPMQGLLPPDDAYDAVAPDELGSEWLSRATEASPTGYDPEREVQVGDIFMEAGMSVMSEGSFTASHAEEVEAAVDADMNRSDNEEEQEGGLQWDVASGDDRHQDEARNKEGSSTGR